MHGKAYGGIDILCTYIRVLTTLNWRIHMSRIMSGFPREKVKIKKSNNAIIDDVEALFSDNTVLIEDVSVVIEDGDYILRTLPNGLTEEYLVVNNGYISGGRSIPSHYQVTVKKNTILHDHVNNQNSSKVTMNSNYSFEELLADDIRRCSDYLLNPNDETGQSLYIDITGRYDSVIENFGSGLYQYFAEQHFYDPDISGESLTHNIKKLHNKMLVYQAKNYPSRNSTKPNDILQTIQNSKVFIVHGHDSEAKIETARVLEKLGLEAIILHEQADLSQTIIEKIEKYSDVAFAVVLYTECDLGRAKGESPEKERFRARQNVVFEHGYLIGKLGRDRVCAIVKGNVDTPGDISGIVYVKMDDDGAWKMRLCKNMKAVGLNVDMNRL